MKAKPPKEKERTFTPKKDYYVRENKDYVPYGPISYVEAKAQAKAISEDPQRSGMAEILTYIGTRDGDSTRTPPQEKVFMIYLRGRAIAQGDVAAFISKNRLPPGV